MSLDQPNFENIARQEIIQDLSTLGVENPEVLRKLSEWKDKEHKEKVESATADKEAYIKLEYEFAKLFYEAALISETFRNQLLDECCKNLDYAAEIADQEGNDTLKQEITDMMTVVAAM